MAKKKLTGTSKLSQAKDPTISTKSADSENRLNLIKKKNKTPNSKSYRLHDSDLIRLKGIIAKVNEEKEAGRAITETDVIRGLVLLGEKTTASKLLKSIKEIM